MTGKFTDNLLKYLGRAFVKLPVPLLRLLAGKARVIDGQELDLHMQLLVRYFSDPPEKPRSMEEMRRELDVRGNWFGHSPATGVERSIFTFQSSNEDVVCEIHRPEKIAEKDAPALLFFHGGGHAAGSLISHRNICRQLAVDANCLVISVDYRLAPEHKFPVGINDSLAAYDAVVERAEFLRIDRNRITVGGDSAGANIAAVIAQQRKSNDHPPRYQILWVPWVELSAQHPSYDLFGNGYFIEKPIIEKYINHYLTGEQDASDSMISPLHGDVENVCPAAVLVAGFDPLRDEGLAYADKLKCAGVPVTVKCYEGLIHPFLNLSGYLPGAKIAFNEATALLRKHM